MSPPSRGAWIEMFDDAPSADRLRVAPLAGAWIEMRLS